MPLYLRQSTASQEIPLGFFVDSTDGNTEETALSIANTDIKIWKTGATTLASKNSGGATHISNGIYYTVLDATDTDTIGPLVVFVHVAGALAVRVECVVLDEAVYDVIFGTTAPATATNITSAAGITLADGAITAAKLAADCITAAKIADGAIDAATFAAGAIDNAACSFTGSELTAIPWNASWDAEVQSEVEDALVVHRLDELLNADSDIDGAAPPTVGSVFHELMTKTTGSFTYDQTTDSLEALRDRGDAAWTTATGFSTHTAADVWAVATRVLTAGTNIVLTKGVGVTGFTDLDAAGVRTAVGLASANLDTQLTAIDDYLDTEVAAIKAKTDSLTFTVAGQVDCNVQYVNDVQVTGVGTAGNPWGPA